MKTKLIIISAVQCIGLSLNTRNPHLANMSFDMTFYLQLSQLIQWVLGPWFYLFVEVHSMLITNTGSCLN